MSGRLRRAGLRLGVSAALLSGVLLWSDPAAIAELLLGLDPRWLLPALLVTVLQVGLSAWRWRFTAARLGIALRWSTAFTEYYLATFLNQVLPGGVTGDAARAWRHARALAQYGPAVRAVVIERASGQLVMAGVAALALVAQPALLAGLPVGLSGVFAVVAAAAGLSGWLAWRWLARVLRPLLVDIRRALLAPGALPVQIATSVAVVATYIVVYLIAARALGVATPFTLLLPLIPIVLLAMLIPLSVSGWGFREAAAAIVWPLAGLPASEGVAIAVAYGLLVLMGSLPGAGVMVARPLNPDA